MTAADRHADDATGEPSRSPVRNVAEVARIATMLDVLQEEVQKVELDSGAQQRLLAVHRRSLDAACRGTGAGIA